MRDFKCLFNDVGSSSSNTVKQRDEGCNLEEYHRK